jgi:hypothetical protein
MNRCSFCALCLVCTASSPISCLASAAQTEASPVDSLLARISTAEIEIANLKSEISDLNPSAPGQLDQQDLQQKIVELHSELSALSAQLRDGNIPHAPYDALGSRNSQSSVATGAHDNAGLLSLPDHLGDSSGLEISGFMDAVYELNAVSNEPNKAYLNQVEIDFVRTLNSRAEASLGVVYSEGFQIGAAVISFQIKPESESSTSVMQSWSASAGQFDAPFGEDVGFYPSNQRKSISVPDVVTNTHNGWNHVGASTTFAFPSTSVDFWTVQGFDLQTNLDLEEPIAELNFSSGSRVNFDLVPGLRFGGSAASGWLPDGAPAMQLYGAHAVFEHNDWSLIAEGIQLEEQVSEQSLLRRGYYVQTVRQLNQFFALARADYIEGSDIDSHRHYSLGGGLNLGSGLELRSEYQFNHKANGNQGLLQIVATF